MLPDNVVGGGGAKINGIVERYVATLGEDIKPGDFVKYLDMSPTPETQLPGIRRVRKAILLSDGRVFIIHGGSGTTDYLYCSIATISGTTVTLGAETQLSTAAASVSVVDAALLSNDKVLILHSINSAQLYLYGMVVSINGTTITPGTDTQLSSVQYSGQVISAVLLSDNRMFVAYSGGGSSTNLSAMMITIGDNILTAGASIQLMPAYSGRSLAAVSLSPNRVFVAYDNSNNENLSAMVVSINDMIITKGTHLQLSSGSATGRSITVTLLSEDRVFVTGDYSASSPQVYGLVATISGTTITTGAYTAVAGSSQSTGRVRPVRISDNKVLVMHSPGDGKAPTGR